MTSQVRDRDKVMEPDRPSLDDMIVTFLSASERPAPAVRRVEVGERPLAPSDVAGYGADEVQGLGDLSGLLLADAGHAE